VKPANLPRAIAFDAFGTLLTYDGRRLNPYRHLIRASIDKQPFLTRNASIATFADELGVAHLLPLIEHELAIECATIRCFDDVAETLSWLRSCGVHLAVCSNLAQPYGEVVRRLLPNIPAVLSFELGAAKPAPVIYRAVCEQLGCPPEKILFIGDSRRADVDGPLAFGMQARQIDRKHGQSLREVLTSQ